MNRADLLTPSLVSAITPRLHSRALPLAVIVFMVTLLGCGIGDWDRPVGKHGYWLRDPSGGVILTGPKGELVIPEMSSIWRVIEDDDWLLLEIGSTDQSRTIGTRWMVVDMAVRRDKIYSTEQEARAALPPTLREQSLKHPAPDGIISWLFRAACVLIFLTVVVLPLTLLVIWRRRRERRLASDHPETPGWFS